MMVPQQRIKNLERTWNVRPAKHSPAEAALADRLLEEMTKAWRRGERPRVEDFLESHHEIGAHSDVVLRLVYHEVCLRQGAGEPIEAPEYVERFPNLRSELQRLFGREPEANDGSFPELGEDWGDYHIVAELGRGAQGRVYLALQQSLATRPQVLKISRCTGGEHLALARLQHTHIVPLYAAHYDAVRAVRTLCMPYYGGTTLGTILEMIHDKPPWKRTGRDILDAIDKAQSRHSVVQLPVAGPGRAFLARASYVQAICWITANIADALNHAHERGLIHLDVKPENVLLSVDGQPMLLDFHLAQPPLRHHGATPERLGGTVQYLSPEQSVAFAAVRESRPVPVDVDGRSDTYSLGLMLYEGLGWALPNDHDLERTWLHRLNPQVSVGLSDIVSKCLAPNPADRYARASELADDLRRHLGDLPLRGAGNRSTLERWRKWRRRRPHALPLLAMFLIVLVTAGAALLLTWQGQRERLHEADAAHREAQELLLKRSYAEAARAAEHGLTRGSGWSMNETLTADLRRQLRQAQRAQAAVELHDLAERVRLQAGADRLHPTLLHALERSCRLTWDKRTQLLPAADSVPEILLGAEMEQAIRSDLLDLAVLGADLHVRGAGDAEAESTQQQALSRLAEAEAALGPSPVLYLERKRHAEALGAAALADEAAHGLAQLPPRSAWEHELVGRSLLAAGERDKAAEHLQSALELQPNRFWAQFYFGICAFRQQRYEESLIAFQSCAVLSPRVPECYYNRGRVYAALKRAESALRDYDRALELNPTLTEAAVNRGVLYYEWGRYRESASDLQRALDNGADPATAHYYLALVHLAQKNPLAAIAQARLTLQHDRQHRHAQELLDRLRRDVP